MRYYRFRSTGRDIERIPEEQRPPSDTGREILSRTERVQARRETSRYGDTEPPCFLQGSRKTACLSGNQHQTQRVEMPPRQRHRLRQSATKCPSTRSLSLACLRQLQPTRDPAA